MSKIKIRRYDIAICSCPEGPHLEQHEFDEGAHCDADEVCQAIAELEAELQLLREEKERRAARRKERRAEFEALLQEILGDIP